MQAVQRACLEAIHSVGIFVPIREPLLRDARAALNIDMDFETLLNAYFDTKEELRPKKDDLIKKALMLVQEQQEKEHE